MCGRCRYTVIFFLTYNLSINRESENAFPVFAYLLLVLRTISESNAEVTEMCGIVGYAGKRQAAPVLLEALKKLEYRGYDSSGVAVREETQAHIEVVKAKGRLDHLAQITDNGRALPGTSGVGHTRWATHGEPSARNAHPHYSREKRVVLVHNGIIENYREIREMLEKRGYVFHTDTDTEAAALLLDFFYAREEEKGLRERALYAIRAMMMRLCGSFAMGILFLDQPGVVYAARRDSPLIVGCCKEGGHILASDVPAVLAHTREVTYIENMEIAALTAESMRIYDMDLEVVDRQAQRIEWDVRSAEKGGWEHFMIKEIHEQPAAVRDTLTPRVRRMEDGLVCDLHETGLSGEEWKTIPSVLFVGCGSAYHAGLIRRCAAEALAGIPCRCELASELRSRETPIEKGTLCVVISQSGETADTLGALRLMKERGIRTLAVVNVVASSIAREADAVLYTHAGPEIAVATTKAYAAQLAAMYLLAVQLADAQGRIEPDRRTALLEALLALPERIEEALSCREEMQRLASCLSAAKDAFFIGRGLDAALCMEGSLKLKEISYIHSEAYAAGELKHGAISLLEEGMPVIAVSTQTTTDKKMRSAAAEARARGAKVFAVAMQEESAWLEEADDVLFVPDTHPLFAASVAVVPLQLLSYYIACERGLDVDKPRNLAKSVTVE